MAKNRSKLVLGTANFGMNYGISNEGGKLAQNDLNNIMQIATSASIDMVDTAQVYGDSESRLGKILNPNFNVITKLGIGIGENYQKKDVTNLVHSSLKKLNVDKLYAVLLHRPEILIGDNGQQIINELRTLKDAQVIKNFGVSIYDPKILGVILNLTNLDIVQVPFNVFDQRILSSGWNERLKACGTKIHIRSIFLQGVLLMQRYNLPDYFSKNWPDLFNSWLDYQENTGRHADEISLSFVQKEAWVDKIVVGIDNAQQLQRLVALEATGLNTFTPNFSSNDINLIDPSRWNKW